MGSENTDHPSSEWLTKPKQSVILPVFMAIHDIMYRQCSTDSFAFVALPEQSMLSMPVIVNTGILFVHLRAGPGKFSWVCVLVINRPLP